MASESRIQPSFSSMSQTTANNSNNETSLNATSPKKRLSKFFRRLFGNLQGAPAFHTNELKQYPINGCYINNKRKTVATKK